MIFGLLARRWVVFVAGVLVTVSLVLVVPPGRGVYWAEADLVFLPPSGGQGNALQIDSDQTVYFAAAVEREYDGRPSRARAASSGATLYGVGVRDGSSVDLVNSGGQWRLSFKSPVLRIQVVADSEEAVRQRLGNVAAELSSIVQARQESAGVDQRYKVMTTLTPGNPAVWHVEGSPKRATAALLLLGTLLSYALSRLIGHFAESRLRAGQVARVPVLDSGPPDQQRV